MAYKQRGLSSHQEQFHNSVIRDTRPMTMRIMEFLRRPFNVFVVELVFLALILTVPGFTDLFLLAGIGCFVICFTTKTKLPFRLPKHSHLIDPNDAKPGEGNGFNKAGGIYLFGNERKTNEELWFTDSDMRTHVLIFGSTGSGKTVGLVSIAYNALVQSSGFIYVDGKGDNTLFSSLFSMVRSMGREDDLLLINFMTGARDVIGPQERRLSNTLNPFASGSSSMLSQLIVGLMGKSAEGGDGDMWKNRAIGFVEALMRVLVAMRDAGHILLDANSIRNYFHLDRLEGITMDKVFIRDGGLEPINLENTPDSTLEPLVNYVLNLPGYNKEKKGKQVSQVLEQHGFITMQLTRAFTSLADTYGHIMRTRLAEVDLKDVVLNRRILCVLLPALEKSPDELANLGKVIISSLKAMMAAGLGDHVEGEYQDLIMSKPTNAETPYLCILDEYGYYAVEGFAVVPAQARSLGFSVVFAGQDLPAFQKASKEEAASIGANTNIKICMKLEDPTETWDFFMKSAGESYVTHVDSFQVDSNALSGQYQDAKGARVEKRQRIDLLDLKEQNPGEYHMFFRSKVIRGRFFYADPKPVATMRLNHLLMVDPPDTTDIKRLMEGFNRFSELVEKGLELNDMGMYDEEYDEIKSVLRVNDEKPPIERSMAVLEHFKSKNDFPDFFDLLDEDEDSDQDDVEIDHLNLFTPMRVTDALKQVVKTADFNKFSQPIINRSFARDQIEYVQRLCGKTGQQAMNVAIEMVSDLERSTQYPPAEKPPFTASQLVSAIDTLNNDIQIKMNEQK
jgi:intracellular multiplication protein IcmO